MQIATNRVMAKMERHSKAKDYVLEGYKVFENVKDVMSTALASYPPAGLAFSGLCTALPVSNASCLRFMVLRILVPNQAAQTNKSYG